MQRLHKSGLVQRLLAQTVETNFQIGRGNFNLPKQDKVDNPE